MTEPLPVAPSRPTGVTVSAVVSIAGSVFTLLTGALVVTIGLSAPPDRALQGLGPIFATTAVIVALFAGLGGWTAVGLWKLRPWARISTLVFAGFLAATSALAMVTMLIIPTPAMPNAEQQASFAAVRPFLAGVYAVPLAIGAWWLVYFNRSSVKAAFAAPYVPGDQPGRPVSISIIGWLSVVGGVLMLPAALTGFPAFFIGVAFTGWSGKLVYVGLGALSLYLGWSVLRLRETGRRLMIGWYVLTIANATLIALVPGVHARFVEMQQSLPFRADAAATMQAAPFESMMTIVMLVTAALPAVMIWFLVRERARFR